MTTIPAYFIDSSREYPMFQRESTNPKQITLISKISQNIKEQHHTKSASDTTWISSHEYSQKQAGEAGYKERTG